MDVVLLEVLSLDGIDLNIFKEDKILSIELELPSQ